MNLCSYPPMLIIHFWVSMSKSCLTDCFFIRSRTLMPCWRARLFYPLEPRWTTGEPEHFKKEDPLPPDQEDPEHLEWIKRGQRNIRTRPDIACAVSLASQVLFKDLSSLKTRLRHLLQYLKTTGTRGLLYLYPRVLVVALLCQNSPSTLTPHSHLQAESPKLDCLSTFPLDQPDT